MAAPQTTLFTAILISVVVVGVIIIYFAFFMWRQQRRNLELSRQNILAEMNAMETERKRIASDLHDDMGPILSVVKFSIDTVAASRQGDSQLLHKASHYVDDLMTRLREITNNLVPAALERKGLETALRDFLDHVSTISPVRFEFQASLPAQLPEELPIHIFRIVQEIAHNIIKHAGTDRASVEIKNTNGKLVLISRDRGAGFDYQEKLKQSTGIGLRSIKSRVNLLKGTMKVESIKDTGTAYLIEIPINKNSN